VILADDLLATAAARAARQFVATQELDAEPRMVVRGNRDAIVASAKSAGVVGTSAHRMLTK